MIQIRSLMIAALNGSLLFQKIRSMCCAVLKHLFSHILQHETQMFHEHTFGVGAAVVAGTALVQRGNKRDAIKSKGGFEPCLGN
jgi:hypothetical protein